MGKRLGYKDTSPHAPLSSVPKTSNTSPPYPKTSWGQRALPMSCHCKDRKELV